MHKIDTTPALIDSFGRKVDYIRLSITDRCDFRCVYCMSEDVRFLPRDEVLTPVSYTHLDVYKRQVQRLRR